MKPSELYARPHVSTSYDLYRLRALDDFYDVDPDDQNKKLKRVEIRYYKDHSFDGERCWTLASVYFDGEPVMIYQEAGRGGRDHCLDFITDRIRYKGMVVYLCSLMPPEPEEAAYDPDEDIERLDTFYGYSLDHDWDRDDLKRMLHWASRTQRDAGIRWLHKLAGIPCPNTLHAAEVLKGGAVGLRMRSEHPEGTSKVCHEVRLITTTSSLRVIRDGIEIGSHGPLPWPELREFIRQGVLNER